MLTRRELTEHARLSAESALREWKDAEDNLSFASPHNIDALRAIERKAAKRYEDAYGSYAELRANTQ